MLLARAELSGALGFGGLQRQQPSLLPTIDPTLHFESDLAAVTTCLRDHGRVVTSSVAPAQCVISAGDGSESCTVGQDASFTIALRDDCGRPVSGADAGALLRVAWLDAAGQEEAAGVGAATALAMAGVPEQPGLWRVTYRWPRDVVAVGAVTVVGAHRLGVRVLGRDVPRSPLTVQVKPKALVR